MSLKDQTSILNFHVLFFPESQCEVTVLSFQLTRGPQSTKSMKMGCFIPLSIVRVPLVDTVIGVFALNQLIDLLGVIQIDETLKQFQPSLIE
jgi:hypothetical protein